MNKQEKQLTNHAISLFKNGKLTHEELSVLFVCMSELTSDDYNDIPSSPLIEVCGSISKVSDTLDKLIELRLLTKDNRVYNVDSSSTRNGYRLVIPNERIDTFTWSNFLNGNVAVRFRDKILCGSFVALCVKLKIDSNDLAKRWIKDHSVIDKVVEIAYDYKVENEWSELEDIDCIIYDTAEKELKKISLEEIMEASIPCIVIEKKDLMYSVKISIDGQQLEL